MAAADSIRGRKCTGFPPVRPVLVATGAHWVEPEVMSSVVDGDIVSGVTYEGNPKFIRLFVKVLGGNITGSDRRILFLCGDFGETSCIPMPWAADLSCSWCFCRYGYWHKLLFKKLFMPNFALSALVIILELNIFPRYYYQS
ncbi:protein DJ-1 homolog D-like isoform X2 [Malus sylvestris]|uniref:protein DJ-1 homolog D-like isoform X2 n=1 Tax=Malus sylvestris TaxID=3752 RepID=UPI0021AC7017|nr:protein DJ-1 homolog D-like isoform X2 [Malus sylvestris]